MVKKKKKVVKREKVDFRVTVPEKKKLVKRADRLEMSISDYLRYKIFQSDSRKVDSSILINTWLVLVQEILNYVQEKYDMDEKLERMVEKLWKTVKNI